MIVFFALFATVAAQFPLPNAPQEAPKTVVSPEYSKYFGLNPGGTGFLEWFRGLIPPPNYEVAGQARNSLGGGIPLEGAIDGLRISRVRNRPVNLNSSIAGIPDTLPNLPKANGVLTQTNDLSSSQTLAGNFGSGSPFGLGPGLGSNPDLSSLLQGSQSPILNPSPLSGYASTFPAGINSLGGSGSAALPYAAAGVPPQNNNLVGQLLKAVGLNDFTPDLDLNALNQILGLSPGEGNVLSQVLYSTLTDKPAETSGDTQPAGRANAAVVQQLLTQPSSPLCNPKPVPVRNFDLDAFDGKYYQVVYSPPMSLGPCSMITFSKLSDIGSGGPGTVLNLFEYTTERTPNGRPSISSGYSIVRAPGELIFRTSSNPTDLNVYVVGVGPKDSLGKYEYIILTVNCNYPIYVYARDPVKYKQKYEGQVNSILEQLGLSTSWARLFNIVAPVDSNLCTFPPTLFNTHDGN